MGPPMDPPAKAIFDLTCVLLIPFSRKPLTAWKAVVTSKNLIVKIIRTTAAKKEIETAEQLREDILTNLAKNDGPTNAAISYLKIEVKKMF